MPLGLFSRDVPIIIDVAAYVLCDEDDDDDAVAAAAAAATTLTAAMPLPLLPLLATAADCCLWPWSHPGAEQSTAKGQQKVP